MKAFILNNNNIHTYIHCSVGLDVQQHLNLQSRLGGVVVRVAEQVVVGLVGRNLES